MDDNMNHFGAGLKYEFTPKLTGFLKYTFSKAYNLYRLNTSGDLKYQDHHNVFMEFDYSITEYGFLVIQFGEGSAASPVWSYTASPFGDFYPTLDVITPPYQLDHSNAPQVPLSKNHPCLNKPIRNS